MTQGYDPLTNGHANGIEDAEKQSNGTHLFDSIEDSVEGFSRGEFVIVLDDASRENEGDLIMAAEDCTLEKMAFMIRYTSGYICAPVLPDRAEALNLPPMVIENCDPHRTAYTVTVDSVAIDSIATGHVTTGISAHDRALTLRTLANAKSTSASFRRPGHVLPLIGKPGGVRQRRGHTEAALELCRLAGKAPAAAICEVVVEGDETGRPELSGAGMMRRDDLLAFGKKWGIKVCTIEDMVKYVERKEGKLKA